MERPCERDQRIGRGGRRIVTQRLGGLPPHVARRVAPRRAGEGGHRCGIRLVAKPLGGLGANARALLALQPPLENGHDRAGAGMQPDGRDETLLQVPGSRLGEQRLHPMQAGVVIRRPQPQQRTAAEVHRQREAAHVRPRRHRPPVGPRGEAEQEGNVIRVLAGTNQRSEAHAAEAGILPTRHAALAIEGRGVLGGRTPVHAVADPEPPRAESPRLGARPIPPIRERPGRAGVAEHGVGCRAGGVDGEVARGQLGPRIDRFRSGCEGGAGADRDHQRRDDQAGHPTREGLNLRGHHEPLDSAYQGATPGRERKWRRGESELLHAEQGHRVNVRVAAACGHREVVAAVLALLPHAPRDPPRRRVVEQQSLDCGLEQVHEVVVAPHVGKLVREQRVELQRREPRQGAGR